VTTTLVADAGPLIALARVRRLHLLNELFMSVLVPPEVHRELRIDENRPGSRSLGEALDDGWLSVATLASGRESAFVSRALDRGESEAIRLAEERAAILLIDDRRGRAAARRRALRIVGTGGILLAAKRRSLLHDVGPVLLDLAEAGYRLSPGLVERILQTAGEADSL